MKIVASTKLNRAQKAMSESRSYGQTSNTVFEKAETKAMAEEGKKTLYIVASSDKGLCGGIHSGLSKKTRALLEQNPDADIVVIGEKSKAQLSRSNGKKIRLSFAGVGKDVPTFADAQAIADQVSLLPTDYSNVQIIYNKFINAQSYEATPIEAFSEEAIKNSRTFVPRPVGNNMAVIADMFSQPTLQPLRSTTRCFQISGNMRWRTHCTGSVYATFGRRHRLCITLTNTRLLLRDTPASSQPAEMPWTTPQRTPVT